MRKPVVQIKDISIRGNLMSGDLGYIIYRHGFLYSSEYKYGIPFELYVAEGLCEFFRSYTPEKDKVWICEHGNKIIGFILLMQLTKHTAQLRYFYIEPQYRGIGLGKRLMEYLLVAAKKIKYRNVFLWTTNELKIATNLYIRYGFKLTKSRESSAFGKKVIEQKYQLALSQ